MELSLEKLAKKLQSFDRKYRHNEDWLDYQALGMEKSEAPLLLHFIADKEKLIDYGGISGYSAVHAWRTLSQFKEDSFIPFLLELLFIPENLEADMYLRDFPKIMGMMGGAALNHLIPLLLETNTYKESEDDLWIKSSIVVTALAEITRINSDKRKEVIQAIETYATEILSERDNFLVSCTLSSLSIIKPTELKELMLHLLNVNRIDHEGISEDEIDKYLA